jgi:enhancer of polycomb-like protein
VPAPPAEESSGIDYDKLYTLEFPNPSTYIRFSQTVEECTGCQYNMTAEDDTYLKSYNQKKAPLTQCSEDDFERIMEAFESMADRQTPFAAVDNTVITYDIMEFTLRQEVDEKVLAFSKDIYEYWKTRRQCSSNRPLQPTLKFEMHQDNDDGDPYVCFRRRDVRQTRKTRARDIQSAEKLRRLRKELEDGRQLVAMAHQREVAKRDLIAMDKMIFEQRAKVKEIRLRLGIKVDDEDLIQQKVWHYHPNLVGNALTMRRLRRRNLRTALCNVSKELTLAYQWGLLVVLLMLT